MSLSSWAFGGAVLWAPARSTVAFKMLTFQNSIFWMAEQQHQAQTRANSIPALVVVIAALVSSPLSAGPLAFNLVAFLEKIMQKKIKKFRQT